MIDLLCRFFQIKVTYSVFVHVSFNVLVWQFRMTIVQGPNFADEPPKVGWWPAFCFINTSCLFVVIHSCVWILVKWTCVIPKNALAGASSQNDCKKWTYWIPKGSTQYIPIFVGFLRGGCSRGGGKWGTQKIPRQDWGSLGEFRED